MAVFRDRDREREYDQITSPPVFSFDSQHLAYAAKQSSNYVAILDGKAWTV